MAIDQDIVSVVAINDNNKVEMKNIDEIFK